MVRRSMLPRDGKEPSRVNDNLASAPASADVVRASICGDLGISHLIISCTSLRIVGPRV